MNANDNEYDRYIDTNQCRAITARNNKLRDTLAIKKWCKLVYSIISFYLLVIRQYNSIVRYTSGFLCFGRL